MYLSRQKQKEQKLALIATGVKLCSSCRQVKKLDEFHRNKSMVGGRTSICKMCRKNPHTRRTPKVKEGFRYCLGCKETKPLTDFSANRSRHWSGYRTHCRLCVNMHRRDAHRENSTRQKELVAGRPKPLYCEICGSTGGAKGIMFDHDHASGDFRGWLCSKCNFCLGHADDNPERLRALANYLDSASTGANLLKINE